MKNKKLIITAFLLLATLTIGIGYAALSDVLTVSGLAKVSFSEAESEFDTDVYFASATLETPNSKDTVTVDSADNDIVTFNPGSFLKIGDTVTAVLTIQNDSTTPASVAMTTTPSSDNFTYSVKWADGDADATTAKVIAANGGTAVVKVSVTFSKLPEELTTDMSNSFTVKLTATAVNN